MVMRKMAKYEETSKGIIAPYTYGKVGVPFFPRDAE